MAALDLFDCFTQSGGALSAFAPTTGTTLAPYYIDRLALMDDGTGADLIFKLLVHASVTSLGSATVDFQCIGHATDPTFASGNTILASTGPIAKASLAAKVEYNLKIKRLPNGSLGLVPNSTFLRYIGFQAVVAVADLTAGSFYSWLTTDGINDNLSYPAGYTV